jgi:hypothetical protein
MKARVIDALESVVFGVAIGFGISIADSIYQYLFN